MRLEVQEPWFTLIAVGEKVIEGRAGPDRCAALEGLRVTIVCAGDAQRTQDVYVRQVTTYETLEAYLEAHWREAAPQAKTLAQAREAYMSVYAADGSAVFAEEKVRKRGGIGAMRLELAS